MLSLACYLARWYHTHYYRLRRLWSVFFSRGIYTSLTVSLTLKRGHILGGIERNSDSHGYTEAHMFRFSLSLVLDCYLTNQVCLGRMSDRVTTFFVCTFFVRWPRSDLKALAGIRDHTQSSSSKLLIMLA